MHHDNRKHNAEYKPYLYNDHFQNYKRHNVPKAQLIIADIPYNALHKLCERREHQI